MMYQWTVLCFCGLGAATDELLLSAVQEGDADAVRGLLRRDSFNTSEMQFEMYPGWETTMVHRAAAYGHAEVLQLLLAAWQAGVQARDAGGRVPLHYASNVDIAQLLLEQWPGGWEASDNGGRLPWQHAASYSSNLELVQELWHEGLNMTAGACAPALRDTQSPQVARWILQGCAESVLSFPGELQSCEVLIEVACNVSEASQSWRNAAADLQCSDKEDLSKPALRLWVNACGGNPSWADLFGMLASRLKDPEAKDLQTID